MTVVRSATSADAGMLAELRWEFRAARQPPVETHDAFVKRCAAWMRSELTTPHAWRAWVAVDEGAIIGQVWLNALEKIPNPIGEAERHAYLSNLNVKPSERGHGVDRVVLWPSPRSVTLYLKHGFTHGGDVMELRVEKDFSSSSR